MNFAEMLKMSEKERTHETEKLEKGLYGLRLKVRTGQEKKTHLVRQSKRSIARLKTAASQARAQALIK